jgi:hypothetical protein
LGKDLSGVYQRQKSPQVVIHPSIAFGKSPYSTGQAESKSEILCIRGGCSAFSDVQPGKNTANCGRI